MGDTIFIFCLALILFGPKKLPEIGRQIGKLMVEFRRASNEFKLQIEDELRASEEAERQKEINAEKTMLPLATAAAELPGASAMESASTSAPVIAPPATGLPVNHTFAPTESEPSALDHTSGQPPADPLEPIGAYPESANSFNPGLNTASNGLIAETPNENPIEAAAFLPGAVELEPGKAQAPIHHG